MAAFLAQKNMLSNDFKRDLLTDFDAYDFENVFGKEVCKGIDEFIVLGLKVARKASLAEFFHLLHGQQAVTVVVCQLYEEPDLVGKRLGLNHLHAADELRPVHEVRIIIVDGIEYFSR